MDCNICSKFFLPFHRGHGFSLWGYAAVQLTLGLATELTLISGTCAEVSVSLSSPGFHSRSKVLPGLLHRSQQPWEKTYTGSSSHLRLGHGMRSWLELMCRRAQLSHSRFQTPQGRNTCCTLLKSWDCLLCRTITARPECRFLHVCITSDFSQNRCRRNHFTEEATEAQNLRLNKYYETCLSGRLRLSPDVLTPRAVLFPFHTQAQTCPSLWEGSNPSITIFSSSLPAN